MSRKFRKTEISGLVKIDESQWRYYDMFCVNCNGLNKHYNTCNKHESYSISPTAEVPSKQSSKRKWDIFKKQFVFAEPIGYWDGIDKSWFFKNVKLKRYNKLQTIK